MSERAAGPVAVAVLWATVAAGMHRAGLHAGDDRTISLLGTVPATAGLFRAGLLVATALLVLFAVGIGRRLPPRSPFLPVFVAGMAGQAVVATVSVAGPWHGLHVAAGLLLGASLPVALGLFAHGSDGRRWAVLAWVEAGACAAGVALSRAHLGVLAEAVPAAGFHLWVLLVAAGWAGWERRQGRMRRVTVTMS
ncbi:MAG TPA: DUF998 domain-containing protein [Acidimicrobiales bacterium]|nr:DUF998 domain-containing protein [Acidimicrobiales bacterium]